MRRCTRSATGTICAAASTRLTAAATRSSTRRGLGGIAFGSLLIKQVVEELRRELPKVENFVTLSPVPGFVQWLKQANDVPLSEEDRELLVHLDEPDWFKNAEVAAQLRSVPETPAAYYFLKT